MLAALGATQAIGQTAGSGPARAVAPAAAPSLDYDLTIVTPDDARPAGGNVAPSAATTPANADAFNPATDEGAMTVLAVTLNGHELRGETIMAVRAGQTLIPADDLKTWRLVFDGEVVMLDGQSFVPLSRVRGLTFHVDRELQQLQLTAPITAFETTTLLGDRQLMPPSRAARTAFLNYDLTLEHSGSSTVGAAYLEMGASDNRGLIDNTMIVSNNPSGNKVIRLDTYAIHDDPSGLTRLTIGDTFTHITTWEQPVRFAGVKWGTDFSLQPGFLSFPTPTFNGQAQIPSNVQLYVNNVLNYQGQVNEGPFALNRLPVVSGAGDVSVVVKDVLGVERRVTSSYYVSTALLRPGLSDFSVEAGAERQNYARESFDYGRAFVAGSFRHGLTSSLTVETRAEGSSDIQDAGAGAAVLVGKIGEVGGAVSGSRGPDGSGFLYRVYASRLGPHWSVSLSYQSSTRDYAQLGLDRRFGRPRDILQASAGANSQRLGSLSANISYLKLTDDSRTRVETVTYGKQFGKLGYFNAFVLRTRSNDPLALGHDSNTTIGASFSMTLGKRQSAFVQIDNNSRRAELQKNLPDDNGWGYRLVASDGNISQQQAELDYRGHAIDLMGAVSRFDGQTAERLEASGGFVLSGSSVLPTRKLQDSFAIVDVGQGQKGVRVFQENRRAATTNHNGVAIITNLRPYEANRISVAPDDLSLESTIANDNILVVPRYLAGVRATFQVTNGHAGTVVIQLPTGAPLEPGTAVTPAVGQGVFYTGFDGEVFIDNMSEGRVLVAKRAAGDCSVILPAVPKGVELPQIGPLVCHPTGSAK